jgi:hypothetical protein
MVVAVRELTVPIAGWTHASPVRIAHISDLHFTRWNRTYADAQRALLGLDYDLLAATGDFCDFRRRWRRAAERTRRFFDPLAGAAPIVAVLGNHDHPGLATADQLPLRFLNNESVGIALKGGALRIAGVDQATPDRENLMTALGPGSGVDGPAVLLAHYPSTVFRLPRPRPPLQLSGHTHGGQIRFPWIGCLWPHDRIPRAFARGLHRVGGTVLHVSPGIGVSLPLRVRINCPPEITILNLVRADGNEPCR